ncbi:DUF3375 domain-containing protein [Acetobacter farinalis]|uniref:DUF3375 domain-containing protein n=1 Tax=Acetobacter farinalis TaxID=1260984 RepID=A0ABT3Q9W6_9PROT|nr:DUF3375 domain-containing protein [Acetobacter farinalis]MCX2562077.1 DUF3375 domain-containing protein [Acetobacter farinalis]NHO30681.1 DUF3375 family protein [Acetobacter farinalis]
MKLDFTTLNGMRQHNPAWRLLCSDHAPLILSFLHQVFVRPNLRSLEAESMAEALEDTLYTLRQQLDETAFPRSAREYLEDWASPEKGWLRKFYQSGTENAVFDMTPATEKALSWLEQLAERSFVGTESRLRTLFDLLRQMNEGTQSDPDQRLADLHQRRDEIDAEIARIQSGDLSLMDDTGIKERFAQFTRMARDLLADFREVEHNFRRLDRSVRERIALWDGTKGALLDEILTQHDLINESDQGRSFQAFWNFLMSSRRQEELSQQLERILALPVIAALQPDPRLRRIHYDWLEAGDHTQRTVARLSHRLREFLDDQSRHETRRITDILHSIEARALALRPYLPDCPPDDVLTEIDAMSASPDLIMERPLYTPPLPTVLSLDPLPDFTPEDVDPTALYEQVVIERGRLIDTLEQALAEAPQISLAALLRRHPLEQGLSELVAYLQLGSERFESLIDETIRDHVSWDIMTADGSTITRHATLQRVIFVRSA